MKKRTIILAVLAVALILSTSLGTALGYFTSYTSGRGGYVIHLENKTELHETPDKGKKTLSISNTSETAQVFVRVLAFCSEDFTLSADTAGTNWRAYTTSETQYSWLYTQAVDPQKATGDLTINITVADKDKKWKDGDERNVIIVYECVPAIFKADGTPDLDTAWKTGKVTRF